MEMASRAYVFIETAEGKADKVVRILRHRLGVLVVDLLEDSPRVVMVVEALEQQNLAELTIRALMAVESMTRGTQILPSKYFGVSDYRRKHKTGKAGPGSKAMI